MRTVAALALLVALLPGAAHALEEDGYESTGALRADFRKADVVVVIQPIGVSPDSSVKALGHVYCTKARVLERFKGSSKVGALIEFCTVFEDKPNEFYARSDRVVFLQKARDREAGRSRLVEIENSSREASLGNLRKMRPIGGKANGQR